MKTWSPPRRIVVPVDLSGPSRTALAAAKTLAKRFRASMSLLSVQVLPESLLGVVPDSEPYSRADLVKQMREFQRWRRERLEEQVRGLDGLKAGLKVVRGSPPAMIARAAGRGPATLVVMGTHGYEGLDRFLFGSVAEAVVRASSAPVLTLHPAKAPFRVRKVLVPCNLEAYADEALAYALAFARSLGARAEVLYVAGPGHWPLDAEVLLKRHLAAVPGAAGLRTSVRYGDPGEQIAAEAARGKFDLIALSAHRRPFLGGFVLGSTAERLLRHSRIPVLSVPAKAPRARRLGAGRTGGLSVRM